MNCKQGDLAVVVSNAQGNNGALLRVVRDSGIRDSGAFWWECELLSCCTTEAMYGVGGRRSSAGDVVFAADSALRPIRDSDGEDEMIRIAGKPMQATQKQTAESTQEKP